MGEEQIARALSYLSTEVLAAAVTALKTRHRLKAPCSRLTTVSGRWTTSSLGASLSSGPAMSTLALDAPYNPYVHAFYRLKEWSWSKPHKPAGGLKLQE